MDIELLVDTNSLDLLSVTLDDVPLHNRMTKMVHFVPAMEKTLAEGVVRLFWNNIWKLYG